MINLLGKAPKILVIGDLMVDYYLWGSSDRISPEAPVPVVSINNESRVLGGAGNVINNLKALNAKVDVMSVIGECGVSTELKSLLNEIEIDTQYLTTEPKRISSKKTRIIAAQQQVVRYDQENSTEITKTSQKTLLSNFRKRITDYDCLLLSDYGKGVLTDELTQQLIKIAKQYSVKILVDPKGLDYSKYKGAYLLTPNKKEASEAINIQIKDNASLKLAIMKLKRDMDLNVSLVTLSEQGIAVFDDELRIHPTFAKEVFDVTGAGDTVLASLGFALSFSDNIDDALKFANLASGVVVGKLGSASASMAEIIDYEKSFNQANSQNSIKSLSEIQSIVRKIKNLEKKIIFTNGCFDLLHIGHIKYLEKAKEWGDILIIGLNSDSSVKNLKGNNRPINSQNDRAHILASLRVVDYVVIFDEDTPIDLIKLIEPDILVKGSDYEGKTVVGEKIAKELKLIKIVDGISTSQTIKRIQNS